MKPTLAELIIEFDRQYPGNETIEISHACWVKWLAEARREQRNAEKKAATDVNAEAKRAFDGAVGRGGK